MLILMGKDERELVQGDQVGFTEPGDWRGDAVQPRIASWEILGRPYGT
jgi:hypothetical protein